MGGEVKKTYLEIAGLPLLAHTLANLHAIPEVEAIWLVVSPEDVEICKDAIVVRYEFERVIGVVAGGATRQESVFAGLRALPDSVTHVLIHDGARPFITDRMVRDVLAAAREIGAATVAVPVKDTLKRADAGGRTTETVSREGLWRIQTPQGFRRGLLLEAHRQAESRGIRATDDASLIEAVGGQVRIVPGDERNLKVTTPDDIPLIAAMLPTLLRASPKPAPMDGTPPRMEIRTGLGYDIHRLVEGRRLILGGVEIPFTHGLLGHSDADALAHAICDALLGAAGLGDIGTHFPDTDPTYEDADSMELLKRVVALVAVNYDILNVDSTIKTQSPKMAPHIPAIRERLAQVLGIEPERVNVKAKTGERMGPVGEGLAIETEAVATLFLSNRRQDG